MKRQSLRGCSPMKRFMAPVTWLIVGMAATLISSCARDAVDVPPDLIPAPLPSTGYGYRSPPVDSQYLPPPGAAQYGSPPGASQYGSALGTSQYGSLPSAPQYGPPPGAYQYGPPPASQYGGRP